MSRAISEIQAGWPSAQTRPGSPIATLVSERARERLEPGHSRRRPVPHGRAPQPLRVGVDGPEGAIVPVEPLADRLEDLGVGLGR